MKIAYSLPLANRAIVALAIERMSIDLLIAQQIGNLDFLFLSWSNYIDVYVVLNKVTSLNLALSSTIPPRLVFRNLGRNALWGWC